MGSREYDAITKIHYVGGYAHCLGSPFLEKNLSGTVRHVLLVVLNKKLAECCAEQSPQNGLIRVYRGVDRTLTPSEQQGRSFLN